MSEQEQRPFPIWNPNDRRLPRFRYTGTEPVLLYALVDPFDGTLRYVGVTRNLAARMAQHRQRQPNPGLRAWFAELRSISSSPRMVQLGAVHRANWEKAERKLIAFFRRRGRLYNRHAGGLNAKYVKRLPRKPGPMTRHWKRKRARPAGKLDELGIYRPGIRPPKGPPQLPPAAAPEPPAPKLSFVAEMNAEVRAMRRAMRQR